jgi:hypothetical protein
MIVEEQGTGFRTGVRFPSGPSKALGFPRAFLLLNVCTERKGKEEVSWIVSQGL